MFLAQEIIRQYARKRISPQYTLKVDMRKANDSVSWDFLRVVLRGLGFPNLFIVWVMECVSTNLFSLAINGCFHGFIKGRRDLCQGDPISPFLFSIYMEYFSRYLKSKTIYLPFNFHLKCKKLKIFHISFADNLILFSKWDTISVSILIDCLQTFESQGINTLKSSIFTVGIYGPILDCIMDMVNFPTGTLSVRYLGIPLASQGLKVVYYAFS